MHNHTSVCHHILIAEVCPLVGGDQPRVSVNPTEVAEIKRLLRFSRRVNWVVRVVSFYSNEVFGTELHTTSNINGNGEVSAIKIHYFFAIDKDLGFTHNPFKVQHQTLALELLHTGCKGFAVPAHSLIVLPPTCLQRHNFHSVGQIHHHPLAVVKIYCSSIATFHVTLKKFPSRVQVMHSTRRAIKLPKASNRIRATSPSISSCT